MESLIFLIVLVIIIVSNLVRIQKKLKESASEQKSETPATAEKQQPQAGLKQYFRDIWAEMQQEMQPQTGDRTARESGRRRPSGWEDLMAEQPKPERGSEPAPARAEAEDRQQWPPPGRTSRRQTLIESRSRQGQTPEARIGETERRAPAPPLKGPGEPARYRPHRLELSREKVRHAVIWYEVLGPPMSLRDPEREMWL